MSIRGAVNKRNAVNPDDALTVRIGLDAVEHDVQDDDFNDALVQLARQIYESTEPEKVLVSDAVRRLAGGKAFEFEPAGLTLAGLDTPLSVVYKLCVE